EFRLSLHRPLRGRQTRPKTRHHPRSGRPRSRRLFLRALAAAQLMWGGDCGILPVVDDGELVGVVTDRDMYIALATRNERASHLRGVAGGDRKAGTLHPA